MTPYNVRVSVVPLLALLAAAIVSGCRSSEPPRAVYVLGSESQAQAAEASQLGQPVVEVRLARLPDYLDTTDLLVSGADGRVVASQTGRWGERLSVGITRAVALALATRLPDVAVTTSPPEDAPWRQVLIDIDSFEGHPDGTCVLAAQWSVRTGHGGLVDKQRIVLVLRLAGTGDAALVAALRHEAEMLADRIAVSLRERAPAQAAQDGRPEEAARASRESRPRFDLDP